LKWIALHYPEVAIERIGGGFERRFAYRLYSDEPKEGLD